MTDNQRSAARRSAENRRCPQCERKSALWYERITGVTYVGCRWCDYRRITTATGGRNEYYSVPSS